MRLEKILTLYFFSPLIQLSRRSPDLKIPILMYHSIARDVDNKLHPYFRTVTTPETFERHMAFLSQVGFQVITLSEAVRLLWDVDEQPASQPLMSPEMLKSRMLPNLLRRPVVVTFDDGFRDFYTTAFPILDQFGFKASVFLSTGCIDKTFPTGRDCLRAREVRELAGKGFEFGSHTVNHPQLKTLSSGEIAYELADSKEMIENITGSQVSLFSYPYAFPEEDQEFTRKLGSLLVEQGYSAGVTTVIGLSNAEHNPLFLRRLPVNDCDSMQFFQAKLDGGYDWLHKVQLMYKRLRATFHGPISDSVEIVNNLDIKGH